MDDPFFSVIIPTYNREHLILKAIDSVLTQTYNNYEIIVVDDGSTDDTAKLLSATYGHLNNFKYLRQQNAERGAARNNGLANSAGKYVTYFDSDDMMCSNHLSEAYQEIEKHNLPEILHLNYIIQDESGRIKRRGKRLAEKYANRLLIAGNFLSCNSVIIRKDIALANKFIEDRDLAAMEDWELWLRIASQHPILYINTVTTILIDHNSRSVVSGNMDNLIKRVNTLLSYVLQNAGIVNYYKKDLNKFVCSCYTYIALHIVLTHTNKIITVRYLIKGLYKKPLFIFERRFLAIIKHLLITKISKS